MYTPTVVFSKKYKQGPIPVTCLKLLENKTFASGCIDSVKIWDSQTGKNIQRLTDSDFQNLETGPVKSMDLLPNGNLVHNIDQYIKVWDLNEYKCLKTLKTDRSNNVLAISDEIIMVSMYESVKVINLSTGEIEKELSDNKEILSRFSKSQKDVVSLKHRESMKPRPNNEENEEKISTSRTLTAADRKNFQKEILMESGEIHTICKADDKLITGSEDKTIKIWNLKTNKCIKTLRAHQEEIKALAFMKEEGFASASKDGTIIIWDSKKNPVKTLQRAHAANITSLLNMENYLVSGSFDKTVKIWEKKTFTCVAILKHKDKVLCLCELGNHDFAVGCSDGLIITWKILPEAYKSTRVLKVDTRFKDINFRWSVEKPEVEDDDNKEVITTETTSLLNNKKEKNESTCCCSCLIS